MKSPKQIKKTKNRPACPNVADIPSLENLLPFLRQQFGTVIIEKQEAERRRSLATLKILELFVSGKMVSNVDEDYVTATCRLIALGPSELKATPAARKALNQALDEIRESAHWLTNQADMVQMRGWGAKGAVVRTILLLTVLERTIGSAQLAKWLEFPNPNLNKKTPVHFLRTGNWTVLADFIDDMLTGCPT